MIVKKNRIIWYLSLEIFKIPACPNVLWVFNDFADTLDNSLILTISWISLESSSLDLHYLWYGIFLLFILYQGLMLNLLMGQQDRSWNYWGLCPFLNHREKMELVCHPPLLSSKVLLLVPCPSDVNCMLHPRNFSGRDSKSYHYWLQPMNWCP